MPKEFKTVEQLIELLNSRNVETDEGSVTAIEQESYYAIVNGYKKPFLDHEAMQSSADDIYLPGTRFQWIHDLFLFDRELRFVTFKYLVKAEAIAKTAVVYAFCERNPEAEAYLDESRYTKARDMLVPKGFGGDKRKLHRRNLSKLMDTLARKRSIDSDRAFISHYMKEHGSVPLWVLANDLTFGNVHHFYQLQKTGVQNAACKIIAKNSDEAAQTGRRLKPQELLRAFEILVSFRNLCAHDERLYCHRTKGGDGYGTMCEMLCRILPEDDANEFFLDLGRLMKRFDGKLHNVTIEGLMSDMGITKK